MARIGTTRRARPRRRPSWTDFTTAKTTTATRAIPRRSAKLRAGTVMSLPPSLHPQVPARPEEEQRRHDSEPEEEHEPGNAHGVEVDRSPRLARDRDVEDEPDEIDEGARRGEPEGPPED